MSRQSKNATRRAAAKQITLMHQKGEKGPAKTTPQHGKKKAWWQTHNSFASSLEKKRSREAVEA